MNRLIQGRLIVFYREHKVATRSSDLFGDLIPTSHRVDRHDRTFHVDLVD